MSSSDRHEELRKELEELNKYEKNLLDYYYKNFDDFDGYIGLGGLPSKNLVE